MKQNDGKRETLTVEEAAAVMGIGRNAAYEAVKNGQIPSIQIGKRRLVPKGPLYKMLGKEAA